MIGVYDSGYGGLTTLRALQDALPTHDFVYLGDSGRAPYGGRDTSTLLDFSEQCVEFLFAQDCPLIIVACHTLSCVALRHLQQRYVGRDPHASRRILGVTIPSAEAAVQISRGHIGIIGTARTVASGTFVSEIAKLGPHKVTQQAAPLLAAIVEEGWEDTDIARSALRRYLADMVQADIDTLILGCTHYPLLLPVMRTLVPPHVQLLDPAQSVAHSLKNWLQRHPGFVEEGNGRLRAFCTGDPERFRIHAERFLGKPLPDVQHIAESNGQLIVRDAMYVPSGQVLR